MWSEAGKTVQTKVAGTEIQMSEMHMPHMNVRLVHLGQHLSVYLAGVCLALTAWKQIAVETA